MLLLSTMGLSTAQSQVPATHGPLVQSASEVHCGSVLLQLVPAGSPGFPLMALKTPP
jgi:hypothetical protein